MSHRYSREKPKFPSLVEKRSAATSAERKAKERDNMSEQERVQDRAAARDRMAQPEAVAAARDRMARPEARTAARYRMARPENVAAARGRMQARRQDPAQPKTYKEA